MDVTVEKRSVLIAVRLSPTEADMLAELVEQEGLRQSDIIRVLIRAAHTTRIVKPSEPKPSRRKKK
jgi:hypothetical protein